MMNKNNSAIGAAPPMNKLGAVANTPGALMETRVATLEQKVAQLEAQMAQLLAVITISNNGGKLTMKANKLDFEAATDLKLKAGLKLRLESNVELDLKSTGTAKLDGGGQLELKCTGITRVKGSTISLNDGSKAVARQSDIAVGASGAAIISGGNPTVLA